MGITITASSTDEHLTTTGFLREITLGATATSTAQDPYMSRCVARASRWAETYLGRPLTLQTYRETVAGFGSRRLTLSRTPIVAVKAVYSGTDTGEATQILTSEFIVEDRDAGFIARNQGFAWDATLQWRSGGGFGFASDAVPLDPAPMPGQEYKPWLIEYVAGWTYDGVSTSSPNWSTEAGTTSTGRTLPEDVEYGVLQKAQSLYENNEGIASEKLGDIEVTYNSRSLVSDSDALRQWEATLYPYRRT